MYLSRVQLDEKRRETIKALASPQILHAAIARALPGDKERSLWRVDRYDDKLYILLQSIERPDLASFTEQFGFVHMPDEIKSYDMFLENLRAGQSWRFRLRANPTHSIKLPDNSRGKVFSHITVGHQRQWLIDRSDKLGFTLPKSHLAEGLSNEYMFEVVESDKILFRRGDGKVTLGIAVFEGILTITDADTFNDALRNGIGRAKAYGCGLLTLARL